MLKRPQEPMEHAAADYDAADLALDELARARLKFRPFNSAHEGYAVVLEELDELWYEVKKPSSERTRERMRSEALQVAAMALRFVVDCTGDK